MAFIGKLIVESRNNGIYRHAWFSCDMVISHALRQYLYHNEIVYLHVYMYMYNILMDFVVAEITPG